MAERHSSAEGGNRSLLRGLAVLDCLGRHGDEGVRVADLVRECALERPTIYRLLTTLIACGYAAQVGRFRYVSTSVVGAPSNSPVDEVGRQLSPVLKRVSELSEDAAFAVVREGTQAHCIARHIGTFPVQVLTVEVGRRQPLGVGAAGLALLASLGEAEASKIIKANASALTAYGAMTPARLQLLLKATRERGWSVVGNHVVGDVLGVGITVPALHGGVTAAISVAASTQRMSQQRQLFLVKTMKQAIAGLIPRST
jgi:DNA-binding IclR family transcriptional regulator